MLQRTSNFLPLQALQQILERLVKLAAGPSTLFIKTLLRQSLDIFVSNKLDERISPAKSLKTIFGRVARGLECRINSSQRAGYSAKNLTEIFTSILNQNQDSPDPGKKK